MLRAAAMLLATEVGHYCVVDVIDRSAVRRIEIAHADASRGPRLRVLCDDAKPSTTRIDRVLEHGSELTARVTEARARALVDLHFSPRESIGSYMAATVIACGSPMAVLSMVVVNGRRRYDEGDLALLTAVADWLGLGLENATARMQVSEGRVRPTAGTFQIRNGTTQSRKSQPPARYG